MSTFTKFLFASSFILANLLPQPAACMQRNQFAETLIHEAMLAQERMREDYLRRERERNEQIQRAIRTQAQYPEGDPRRADADEVVRQLRRQEKSADAWEETGKKLTEGLFNAGINEFTASSNAKRDKELAQQKAIIENMGNMDRLKEIITNLKDPKNLQLAILFLLGATGATVGGYYTLKIAAGQIEKYYNKPNVVRESSRSSLTQSMRKYLYALIHGQPLEADLTEMVFDPATERIVYRLAEDAKQMHEYGLTYENAIFYGPPGTGKTEFARLIARYSGLDYAICSAADITKPEQIRELYDWADASPNGMIIFIDESEVMLGDRSKYNDQDRLKLINEWLSLTGSPSTKSMTIIATNYLSKLDSAARSRFPKVIEFDLPALPERTRMVQRKIEKDIINDIRTYELNGETISATLTLAPEVTPEYIASLASRMDNFSGRDIDQLVKAIRTRAYRSGLNLVSKTIVEEELTEKIERARKNQLIDAQQNSNDTATLNKLMQTAVAAA